MWSWRAPRALQPIAIHAVCEKKQRFGASVVLLAVFSFWGVGVNFKGLDGET